MFKLINSLIIFIFLITPCFASDRHLDSEYRNRYQLYYLNNGRIYDSRETNWRDTEWEQVVKICVHIRNKEICINDKNKPGFKGFLNFRWGGREAQYAGMKFIGYKEIKIWTIGWTDGTTAFLKNIDFRTGKQEKIYQMPLIEIKSHVHPNLNIKF